LRFGPSAQLTHREMGDGRRTASQLACAREEVSGQFNGKVNWVTREIGDDNQDQLIGPEVLMRAATTLQ
jgi:hypothetical protein